jgi:dephospho-CoA kinase
MSVIIGLTGGIGSGKTTIAKVFAQLGVPVFDADTAAKNIMNTSPIIQEKLMDTFGKEVYDQQENGALQLNRSLLAQLVFADPFKLEQLNAIVHPITIQAALDWANLQTAPYVIKEAALFFESGSSMGVKKIIGVTAPKALRIHRVMKREACSKQEVEKRMMHQIEESLKMKLCDWVIVNDDQQLVLPQVVALHEQILASL